MKKLVLAFMMGAAAMAANAQVNYKVQTACHPQDVKHYDTELLRSRFMMDKVMAPDEINLHPLRPIDLRWRHAGEQDIEVGSVP